MTRIGQRSGVLWYRKAAILMTNISGIETVACGYVSQRVP